MLDSTRKGAPNYNLFQPHIDPASLEDASAVYQAWLKSWVQMNTLTSRFVTKRLQSDAQLPMELIQCRSPSDVAQLQIRFFKTMADDYSAQARHLGEILKEGFHAVDRPETLDD